MKLFRDWLFFVMLLAIIALLVWKDELDIQRDFGTKEQKPANTAFCQTNGYKGAVVRGGVLWCVKHHPEGMLVPYDPNIVPTP